jgi:hypothetical protein
MLASELIRLLESKISKLGDQEVAVWDSDDGTDWHAAPIIQIRQNRLGQLILESDGD